MRTRSSLHLLFSAVRLFTATVYPERDPVVLTLEFSEGPPAHIPLPRLPFARAKKARHSDDFRSVNSSGKQYSFTPAQAAVIRVLWRAWENGTPDVGQETLLEAANAVSGRLRNLFYSGKGSHQAWGELLGPGAAKGTFRLILPDRLV